MSESGKAVFLSYASQDAEAAKRICEALRAAGVEVWFDQSELVGGDAWDQKIRRQIKECALFMPVISANSNARLEGYFRREWRLAVDRMHDMDDDVSFLLPVVVDDTSDAGARVPERFRERQWTRLKGGETPAAFGERVKKLLSGDGGRDFPIPPGAKAGLGNPVRHRRSFRWWWVAPMFGIMMAFLLLLREKHPAETAAPATAAEPPAAPAAPTSEAADLVRRARAMTVEKYDSTADDFAAAEALVKQALVAAPNDGEVWAFSSVLNKAFVTRGFDRSAVRSAAAREQAERALKLAPDSIEAQYALAYSEREIDPVAAEKIFRHILELQPDHPGSLLGVSNLAFRSGRLQESQDYLKKVAANPTYAPLAGYLLYLSYFNDAQFGEAERAVRGSIALKSSANSVAGLAMVLLTARGDVDGAAEALASASASRNEPRTVWMTAQVELCRRRPDDALNALDRLTDDFIHDSWYVGPKAYWVGRAQALAGRPEAARIAWQAGLATTESHLEKTPENRDLHLIHGELLALLGRTDEAIREAQAVTELDRGRKAPWFVSPVRIYAALGRADAALPLLQALCPPKAGGDIGWPLTPALLRLDPLWDRIRDDPRFRALAADGAPAVAADDKSVAVLAFANLSDDKENEYFSDGISEELINVLAKIPGLRVIARTSAFSFKGRNVAVAEIAKQLGVGYVIDGSVRKAGNQVRIVTQLINAATGASLWSESYQRELKDVFAIQDEIAGAIAAEFRLKMNGEGRAPANNIDPEAYRLLLAGRAKMYEGGSSNRDAAIEDFRQAVAITPTYAVAWAEMARAFIQNARGGTTALDPAFREARSAAQKAAELEPDSPEVLVALGWVRRTADWDWRGAEQAFRRALVLRPDGAGVVTDASVMLNNSGHIEESIRLAERAVELDPLNPEAYYNLSIFLGNDNQLVAAEKAQRRAVELAPHADQMHRFLSNALADLGRLDEAALEAELEPAELDRIEARALILLRRGKKAEALALAQPLEHGANNLQDLAELYALADERDLAFATLDKSVARHETGIAWLKVDSYFAKLYGDPRWAALLRKVNLADDQLK